MTGFRALVRWVLRVVRMEWRQHALVVAMVGFGIAIAVLLVSATVRSAEPQESHFLGAGAVGTLVVVSEDPSASTALEASVSELLSSYPELEVMVGGERIEDGLSLLGTDPEAPVASVNFSLLGGRWPQAGEVALTTEAVRFLESVTDESVAIGQVRMFGDSERTIVGIWENPNRLDRRTVLAPIDDLTWVEASVLLPSGSHPAATEIAALNEAAESGDSSALIGSYVNDSAIFDPTDSSDDATLAYLGATILCFQIAILASAGFTVLAQRRTRQLGMLSAMGASPRRLGMVMRLTGLIVGIIGGVIGLLAGVALAVLSTPLLQSVVNHRLGAFDLPWSLLLPTFPLAVITAIAASWWPARRVRRTSTVDAIAARRPPETNIAPAALVGVLLLAIGTYLLVVGAPKNSPMMIVAGASALVIGSLLLIPGVVSILGAVATAMPLPVRVAWRDINRNRARSAAAVGAAAIALAVPFGLASFVASLSHAWVPFRPDTVVSVFASSGDFDDMMTADEGAEVFDPLSSLVPDARLIPLQEPVYRELTTQLMEEHGEAGEVVGDEFIATFSINMLRSSGTQGAYTAFATPELLDAMGIDPPNADTDLLALTESSLDLPDANLVVERRPPVAELFPEILVVSDLDGLSRDDVVINSWMLVQDDPFTQEQLDLLEATALRSDDEFGVGLPDGEPPFVTIRATALLVAGLLGISVVAVSVALIRIENENETRALNAVGASPSVSRAIGAATAAGMALVAAVVAVPAAFLTLMGVYLNPDETFDFAIPWIELGVVGIVIPLVAAAGGWLLTTTETKRAYA